MSIGARVQPHTTARQIPAGISFPIRSAKNRQKQTRRDVVRGLQALQERRSARRTPEPPDVGRSGTATYRADYRLWLSAQIRRRITWKSTKRNRKPPFRIKYWERPNLEKLSAGKRSLFMEYNLMVPKLRPAKAIMDAEQEMFDRIWYDRHQLFRHKVSHGQENTSPGVMKIARAAARKLEAKYGKRNLRRTAITIRSSGGC